MRPRGKIWVLLLTCMCIGAVAMFCKPPANKENPRDPDANSTGVGPSGGERLSKTEILGIAERAAREKGLNPKRCDVVYDEENRFWRLTHPKLASGFEGHDYQAIYYVRKVWGLSAVTPLWVLIDTRTGDVLRAEFGGSELP